MQCLVRSVGPVIQTGMVRLQKHLFDAQYSQTPASEVRRFYFGPDKSAV